MLLRGMVLAAEPAWNPSAIKECNRACLVDFMNRYLDAIYKHDPKAVPPLANRVSRHAGCCGAATVRELVCVMAELDEMAAEGTLEAR